MEAGGTLVSELRLCGLDGFLSWHALRGQDWWVPWPLHRNRCWDLSIGTAKSNIGWELRQEPLTDEELKQCGSAGG